jgi:hypothetical protein
LEVSVNGQLADCFWACGEIEYLRLGVHVFLCWQKIKDRKIKRIKRQKDKKIKRISNSRACPSDLNSFFLRSPPLKDSNTFQKCRD